MAEQARDMPRKDLVLEAEATTEPAESVEDLGEALILTRNGKATATESNRGFGKPGH